MTRQRFCRRDFWSQEKKSVMKLHWPRPDLTYVAEISRNEYMLKGWNRPGPAGEAACITVCLRLIADCQMLTVTDCTHSPLLSIARALIDYRRIGKDGPETTQSQRRRPSLERTQLTPNRYIADAQSEISKPSLILPKKCGRKEAH